MLVGMSNKNYNTSNILVRYLKETLEIEKMKLKSAEGFKFGKYDKRKVRSNDEKKVRVMDNHVFRSMANLIYFFEFLNNNPELIDKFGEDIEELFGLKVTKDPKLDVFRRFIEAILGFKDKNGKLSMSKDQYNFRRRLLAIMQSSIHRTTWGYFLQKDTSIFREKAHNDFMGAEVWTKLIDRPTPHENKKCKRLLAF
jgi:hypothetical protein